jgi:hypothetical protein
MARFVIGMISLACVYGGQALAAEAQFSLVNNTVRDITHVYVSTPGNGVWSYDLLADTSRLQPGQEARITVPELQGCRGDIRVRYADQQFGYRSGVDMCKAGVINMRK